MLIIWTDCDREGENIGDEIRQAYALLALHSSTILIQVCLGAKRNLLVQRARFSEITAQAVQRAMNNLQMLDDKQAQAVDARQELDLRIGACGTLSLVEALLPRRCCIYASSNDLPQSAISWKTAPAECRERCIDIIRLVSVPDTWFCGAEVCHTRLP